MDRSIVHGRLFEELQGFYPATCTVQKEAEVQGPDGHPSATPQTVPGLADIPCTLGPPDGDSGGSGREIRRAGSDVAVVTHRIGLRGHFPQITDEMTAVVGAERFNVLVVLHDSQGRSTYLDVELTQ